MKKSALDERQEQELAKVGALSMSQNLLGSVICSGIFSIFYAFIISRKASEGVNILKYTGIFFIGITVLCFSVLCIMGKIAQSRKEREENRYSE